MSQYKLTVVSKYTYLVDANNEHEAINIYLNDNDSCIPLDHGNMNIETIKINPDDTRFS